MLNPALHGKGLAAEALAAVLAWTDANLKEDAIVAMVDATNAASLQLATRCGFKPYIDAVYHGDAVTLLKRSSANSSPART